MKRFTRLVFFLVLAAILCSALVGCASGASNEPSVVCGGKYVYEYENETKNETMNERSYYVFNEDHTGYYQRNSNYHYQSSSSISIYSGKADFIWRVADDGSVYLFQTKITYNADDTHKDWNVGTMPLSFADEFVVVMNSNGTLTRFILEGSDLEKSLNEE